MPVSSNSGKQFIKSIVSQFLRDKMLDIGVGCGTYADMFPDAEWTGVEAWEPYVEEFKLLDKYQRLIVADARELSSWSEEHFDVAFAGDVLEHMARDEAVSLVEKLKQISDVLVISIPIGYHPQGEVGGNPFERHVTDNWTDKEAREAFGEPTFATIEGEIGVYIYDIAGSCIPRVIHVVWVGDEKQRPDNCINTWREMNPAWTVKVWGNKELEEHPWRNKARMQTMAQRQWCGVADMMRYEILFDEGGFAIDADSFCKLPLEEWLFSSHLCASWENETVRPDAIACGYIASAPGHPVIGEVIKQIREDDDVEDKPAWYGTGPRRLTNVWNAMKPEDGTIWPSHYFIPDHFDGFTYEGDGKVFATQEWGTTKSLYDTLHKRGRKLRIAIYAISKNEEKFIERWCKSAEDADVVVLADTGSTDRTTEIARQNGAQVHSICITPWRFDHARNAALALVPRDIDVCISLDVDEIMEPGWREEIERAWTADTTRLRYYFDWGAGIKFKYEKIHARHGYYWHHPCHEYPVPDGRIKEVWAESDMLLVSHHPDPTKSRGQYLELLEMSVREDPRCPRNAFYHARELTFHSRWNDAIHALNAYLKMPEATWPNERCYAHRLLGKAHEELGNPWEAEAQYHRACAEASNTREPWCAMAMLYYRQHRWLESFTAAMRALSIKDRHLVYTCDPEVWGSMPHDLAALAAWHLNYKDMAIEQGKLALTLDPESARLQDNLNYYLGNKTQAA